MTAGELVAFLARLPPDTPVAVLAEGVAVKAGTAEVLTMAPDEAGATYRDPPDDGTSSRLEVVLVW